MLQKNIIVSGQVYIICVPAPTEHSVHGRLRTDEAWTHRFALPATGRAT